MRGWDVRFSHCRTLRTVCCPSKERSSPPFCRLHVLRSFSIWLMLKEGFPSKERSWEELFWPVCSLRILCYCRPSLNTQWEDLNIPLWERTRTAICSPTDAKSTRKRSGNQWTHHCPYPWSNDPTAHWEVWMLVVWLKLPSFKVPLQNRHLKKE